MKCSIDVFFLKFHLKMRIDVLRLAVVKQHGNITDAILLHMCAHTHVLQPSFKYVHRVYVFSGIYKLASRMHFCCGWFFFLRFLQCDFFLLFHFVFFFSSKTILRQSIFSVAFTIVIVACTCTRRRRRCCFFFYLYIFCWCDLHVFGYTVNTSDLCTIKTLAKIECSCVRV